MTDATAAHILNKKVASVRRLGKKHSRLHRILSTWERGKKRPHNRRRDRDFDEVHKITERAADVLLISRFLTIA